MSSILLRSGLVIDGLGNPPFKGHMLIEGDRIKDVSRDTDVLPMVDTAIDATDCAISPGFIDMHSHLDWVLPLHDHPDFLKCLLEQGITTLVGGNCGCSPAPVTKETLETMATYGVMKACIDRPIECDWQSMGEFLSRIEEIKPIVNLAQLVGHGTVRTVAAGTRRVRMNQDELQNCLDVVRHSLDEGACGLSFGLGYEPGMYSPDEEIEAFCTVAAKAQKPVTVHLRAYSRVSYAYSLLYLRPHNVRALEEMIKIARHTGVKLQVSHLVFVGARTWFTANTCIEMIHNARREGIDIMTDVMPYTCGPGTINLFPPWFLARLPEAIDSWWARNRLRAEFAAGHRLIGWSYKDYQVLDPAVEAWEDIAGLSFVEIANRWKTSPTDVLLKLSKSSKGAAQLLYHGYGDEETLDSVLSSDLCLFETDAVMRRKGYPYPGVLGAFPKVLGHYVRERKLISIENAVRRMTSASADRFGLKERGRLGPGKVADIVVFDPQTILDTPPVGDQPAGRPAGIRHVFLNGVHAVNDGAYVHQVRAGRVLRV
jgi:N-acyl-D-amino-acid deacylase